ncbi:homoserine/homoserine lactone efflux protein [Pseudomonas daroniae]|uniref:Homoserine/homoserine lactone efflux protein n=1 Tax=Phytopseudomonas daroniae TaxID=2487519 RepID=A0A4Q9QS99_9GAMM|nr:MULTISPECIES: homoserine/homoserine lactone efflux protein [Pseudomonas]TBU71312.1 homoserine/homoserine lactone efflux protein [Pseudomonas daroniae]TBU82986.1 homoserine/homoserine lactone efflux protein [Pseudomonas sp. FRB 228]TBU84001.1 homoserine/homoserine lactone efflux protein [Pseudomonas daroniae]TBU93179.1 homoserine/homoserine lactone efflux protein [Pseudomonas daroniae]
MALETWLAFFVACWLISLSPGAGAIASMSAGLQYGFLRGYWNALGLQLGLALQIAIVAAGVGAVLATSALAFSLIKWFGVAYLVYLGWRQWRALPADMSISGERPIGRPLSLVLRGFLVNFGNPKAIVFMLAVLPQFINPHAPLVEQYLTIGVTMIVVDLIVMAGYTGLAVRVLRLLRTPRQQRIMNRSFGVLFVGAAALLATVRRAPV